jgi:hypothetical protein
MSAYWRQKLFPASVKVGDGAVLTLAALVTIIVVCVAIGAASYPPPGRP